MYQNQYYGTIEGLKLTYSIVHGFMAITEPISFSCCVARELEKKNFESGKIVCCFNSNYKRL